MKKTEEHHRRPESLGGTDLPSNVSYVQRRLHECWHTLFGNMNSEQVANEINMSLWKPEGVTVVCRFINGTEVTFRGEHNSKKVGKREKAWSVLFNNMRFQEAINYINSVWLDPSYHLYVVK